jgi:hypothetical protein
MQRQIADLRIAAIAPKQVSRNSSARGDRSFSTVQELVDSFGDQIPADVTLHALSQMEKAGVIRFDRPNPDKSLWSRA